MRIVAFGVASRREGELALERLDGVAQDSALVYRNGYGHVRVRQSSDLRRGDVAMRGALLGAAVSVFVAPLVGLSVVGGGAGAAYVALRAHGLGEPMMQLATHQLEADRAAVFVVADDGVATAIEAAVRASGIAEVVGVHVSPEVEPVLRSTLRLS
jgi:uncharacterized membrane protein